MNSGERSQLAAVFVRERPLLLSLLYRLTGSSADAEDLVQTTFERALTHPPSDRSRPWRPWLVRVAVNLGRDHLRRRRRRRYVGPWLPAPLETAAAHADTALIGGDETGAERPREPETTEGRYELLERVSYAFMVALEALTPTQRAVLLLRDVLEYDTREAADALELREANVRQHLRRARRALADHTPPGTQPSASDSRAHALLAKLLGALRAGDVETVHALLAEDVELRSDGGGEFHTARVPVIGRSKVARFYLNLARSAADARTEARQLNGGFGLLTHVTGHRLQGLAPCTVSILLLDAEDRITRIFNVAASSKLRAIHGATPPRVEPSAP